MNSGHWAGLVPKRAIDAAQTGNSGVAEVWVLNKSAALRVDTATERLSRSGGGGLTSRSKQPAPAAVPTGFPLSESEVTDVAQILNDIDEMLSRLRLGAIREQLDGLLEEAA